TAYDNGKMDGFDLQPDNSGTPAHVGKRAYVYLNRTLTAPYWAMARQYTLADQMFPTEWGGSFSAHLDLIAGTAEFASNKSAATPVTTGNVWGCDASFGTTTQYVS